MIEFIDRIKKRFVKKTDIGDAEAERLRNDFRDRYHHFKLLLNANNKALEILAEIEHACFLCP